MKLEISIHTIYLGVSSINSWDLDKFDLLEQQIMIIDKERAIAEMIDKEAFSSEGILIGKIVSIIDQPDNERDNVRIIGDIKGDLFQVAVALNVDSFPSIEDVIEVLFSSQTIGEVSEKGVKFKIAKQVIVNHIEKILEEE